MNRSDPAGPLLEARVLGRRHPAGEGWLLEDVSLELRAGDRVALIGSSGAGKTLLLRALAFLDPFDRGEVLFEGAAVGGDAVPAFRRAVTYCHQRPALFAGTVEDNLRRPFDLRIHRESGYDREKALELLGKVGRSEQLLDQKAEDLSGGEGQIVALVRALQLEPRVLLLDEPTAALDPEAVESVLKLIEDWLGERGGAAMIWVGHDRAQSRRMGERMLEISGGRLQDRAG